MHASCESPWYLSAKHHFLEARFLLMVPFRTRFSPCEMVRTANVQRLKWCLYTLRYCYIPICRFARHSLFPVSGSPVLPLDTGGVVPENTKKAMLSEPVCFLLPLLPLGEALDQHGWR